LILGLRTVDEAVNSSSKTTTQKSFTPDPGKGIQKPSRIDVGTISIRLNLRSAESSRSDTQRIPPKPGRVLKTKKEKTKATLHFALPRLGGKEIPALNFSFNKTGTFPGLGGPG